MTTKSAEEWAVETTAKIREAFDLFDKDKSESVIVEEVGTIMRALGCFPSVRISMLICILLTYYC